MLYIDWKKIIVIVLVTGYLFTGPFILYAKEYRVVTENFAPFAYIKDGKLTGLSIEIVQAILNDIPDKSVIEVQPWARAYKETLKGPKRILFSMARTDERETLFKWVGPLVSDRVFFYKRKQSNVIVKTLDDAKQVDTILLVQSFPEHKFLLEQGFKNLYIVTSPAQSMSMLIKKRGDIMPIGELAVPNILKETKIPANSIERTDVKLYEVHLFIAFSKDISDEVVHVWQESLNRLKKSGLYEQIVKKYVIK